MTFLKKILNVPLMFLLFSGCSLPVQARVEDPVSSSSRNSAIPSNRNGRVIAVGTGVGFVNGIAKFASAGYHINQDWLIEGYYEKSDTFFFGTSTARAIRSKNFWSPTLYTNIGVLHRQTSGRNEFLDVLTSTFTGKETHYDIAYWDIGPGFSIGNQWQWSAFHVGCDWVGVYWPLYASPAKITKNEDGVITKKTADDDLKPEASARLLRLYLGFSI